MNKTISLALGYFVIIVLLGACGKSENNLTPRFEYDLENNEGKAITSMRMLGFDDQGIPGNPEPKTFCFSTGGNCVCDVETTPAVAQSLQSLDQAIVNGAQAAFFRNNHYADVFDVNQDEVFPKVQKKLRQGKLMMVKTTQDGEDWYFGVKPQHTCFPFKKMVKKAVIVLPTVPDGSGSHE